MTTSTLQLVARPPIHPSTFDKLDPQRRDQIHLFVERGSCGNDEDVKNGHPSSDVRYSLTIIDRSGPAAVATAVFLIPAGREAEYMFTHGLSSIADSAKASRLIAVAQGRHHVFHSTHQIQEELAYVCQILHRGGTFVKGPPSMHGNESIPFMALSGVGEREILYQGHSELSGDYIIEQVTLDDSATDIGEKGEESLLVRRLYFQSNPFVIQSELYYHSNPNGLFLDPSRAFEYHKTIVAGLVSLSLPERKALFSENEEGCAETIRTTSRQAGLLLGLGGGGLIHLVHWILPRSHWLAVELDPDVVELAQRYFDVESCVKSGFLEICVGNALHVSTTEDKGADLRFADASLSFIVIDVDSKDNTVGMSCPPQEFVEISYLKKLAVLLGESGILAVNVSARDPKLLDHACKMIHSVFPFIFVSKHDDSINVVVFASQHALTLNPNNGSVPEEFRNEMNETIESLEEWEPSSVKVSHRKRKKNKKKGKKR